jgi:glutamine amidotransferase
MCRLAGYLGEPVRLQALVEDPPHGLLRQSWAAREMQAVVNADGWGAGFYLPGEAAPCVYTSTGPIWSDPNRAHLGRAITSGTFLAAVRSATDPLSVSSANTQPFASGRHLFLHNGFVEGFRGAVARRLQESLGPAAFAAISGTTDSAHLFALLLDDLDRHGAGPGSLQRALTAVIDRTFALARASGVRAFLALLASDGERLVAARAATHGDAPSLYVLPGPAGPFPGTVVASEPLDGTPGWRPVEEGQVLVVERAGSRLAAAGG